MENLGVEFISVFGMPPVAFVELAADLGCRHISTGLQPMDYNPHGYPKWSLKEDRALRRELVAALRDRGVSLSLGEGFGVIPDSDQREAWAANLDIMSELGIRRINSVTLDPDLNRSFDQLGALAEMAAAAGMETMLEFVPGFGIADLPTAVAAVRHVGRRDFRLMIDTMHVGRSGASAADLAALEPEMIGYVQLCDAPLTPALPDYLEEAMYERRAPGEGELPLLGMLAAIPRDRVVGLEAPMRSQAEAGVGPQARLGRCVEAARNLWARLEQAR